MSLPQPQPESHPARNYRYYELILGAFVTVLLCTNLISAPKRVEVNGFVFGAGVLFFPISYLFGDVLTEVYGYARSRKVVWAGFGALLFATVMTQTVLRMPPDPSWAVGIRFDGSNAVLDSSSPTRLSNQAIWETVFGGTWRVMLASMVGFFAGEFANSYTMAKMKVWTEGRFLWTRTIGSTIVGEAADSLLFYPIAFLGIWQNERVVQVLITNYCLKVGWEMVATPLTYAVVNFLKRAEHEDYYDRDTDFTPFSIET
ncbi:MAG: queuosine precursor transporter [Isosphaeraceae bacterium]